MNGEEKKYGKNKKMYGVIERQKGRIELRVYHQNKVVRERIEKHSSHPRYFFENLQSFADRDTSANFWLARVVVDYANRFKEDRVDIVLL
jgi:hypothetical protein